MTTVTTISIIHFVANLIGVAISAGVILGIMRLFSKKSKISTTYEFKFYDLYMCEPKQYWSDEEQKRVKERLTESWKGLEELGKQGWKIVGVNQTHYHGIEYILQRETIHGL